MTVIAGDAVLSATIMNQINRSDRLRRRPSGR